MPSITATIICKNEADQIEACLKSLSFVDEIVVLDSGSTDDTVAICQRYTDKVFETDWPGYGAQKNRALQMVTSQWVLSIDADEQIPPALAEEIRQSINTIEINAFDIRRVSYFLGKRIRFGDWKDKLHVCLFRHGTARFEEAVVHEKVLPLGPVARLKHTIDHFSYTSPEDVERKIQEYGALGAAKRHAQGKKGGFPINYLKAGFAFIRSYLIKLGFLDGLAGFRIAVMNARTTFIKYSALKNK